MVGLELLTGHMDAAAILACVSRRWARRYGYVHFGKRCFRSLYLLTNRVLA